MNVAQVPLCSVPFPSIPATFAILNARGAGSAGVQHLKDVLSIEIAGSINDLRAAQRSHHSFDEVLAYAAALVCREDLKVRNVRSHHSRRPPRSQEIVLDFMYLADMMAVGHLSDYPTSDASMLRGSDVARRIDALWSTSCP
jgi:hypothetical protein